MSEMSAEARCEHFYVWHSPAGFTGGVEICSRCGEPSANDLARMIADAKAAALLEAARYFEYDMSPAWGGDTRWISTGTHVADLVANVLRERAAEILEGGTS